MLVAVEDVATEASVGRVERAACRRYAIVVSPGLVTSKMLPTRGSDTPYLKRVVDTRLWSPQNASSDVIIAKNAVLQKIFA